MDYNEKLRKIEALFEGATTDGERKAAELAKHRVLARFQEELASNPIEFTVRLGDRWGKRLFVALCNKYGLRTYRYKHQKYTTTMVRVAESFMNEVLWPEFQRYSASLSEFVSTVTDDLISKIHEVEEDTIVSGKALPA
ncbi:hypothetical protein [Candidatus Neptunochlamydia vexilliferae]|uniref:hypothetical protein n=1 Tax=Candidatus Neptunichlamydia vexilliferae TaxID=1651774 RepID=UPI0018912166|nr:hypothetical protein [Candidatus Neptunochlamydia vexilliferae]